jgi:hypothetical protein|tara:strand:+ start:470 stop:727 length:258 start_codon:yes stop_codon:yes gene_type:complete
MLFERLTGYALPRIARKRVSKKAYGITKTKNFYRIDFGLHVWYVDQVGKNTFYAKNGSTPVTKIVDNQGVERVEHVLANRTRIAA